MEVCEKRDVKGMYKKARTGVIQKFTGVTDPYEEPVNADLVVDTSNVEVQDLVVRIIKDLSLTLDR